MENQKDIKLHDLAVASCKGGDEELTLAITSLGEKIHSDIDAILRHAVKQQSFAAVRKLSELSLVTDKVIDFLGGRENVQ